MRPDDTTGSIHFSQTDAHALRYTFATLAVGDPDNPLALAVAKRLIGHASLQTTSIYVQAERERSIKEVRSLYAKRKV